MHLPAFVLLTLISLSPAIAAAQATLNKCIDAQGAVTYSNKPCSKAQEVHKVNIDPAPVPDLPRPVPVQMQTTQPAVSIDDLIPAPETRPLKLQRDSGKATRNSSASKCDTLSNTLGRVLDKMDQARRKGYTLEQMNKWNEEVRNLERQKQQSRCF
ncbi:MAG: DUF4124 domain-containing protein [Sulfuriferula multivorans]|uniref:DUF4124 domain-containing protein n=1 Tax=Sulfuriferula multivorans TaxID=1559896 RepID=A0A7C9P342_9PROT|nr:DUF4124 domain-containing protein [Sulfuriferula multivorans]